MGHALDTVGKYGHYIADAAAIATGNPELIPAIEGANSAGTTLAQGGSFGDALKSGALSAGGSYAGSQLGAALFPGAGNVGGALNTAMGGGPVSNFISNTIPASLANIGIGEAIGGFAGNSIGNSLGEAMVPKKEDSSAPAGPAPFIPTQEAPQGIPPSLSGMSSLTSNQQSTNLANQGVYGGGLGPQEQSYFLNLENRKLVGPEGNVGGFGSLMPIEQSYLQQLGLPTDNPTSLLEAISKRRQT